MARYITLNLVNDQGTPVPWPGTPTQFELGTQESVVAVWIGVSADGSDNQIYPLSTSAQTILNSWPRLYQGVQVSVVPGADESPLEPGPNEYVFYNALEEFNRLVAACCVAVSDQESPVCQVSFDWEHLGGNGNMTILVDGVPVVEAIGLGSGSFTAPAGSSIQTIVEGGNAVNSLEVENDVDGQVYFSDNGSGEFGEDYTFTAECGKAYTLTGVTTPGE